MARPVRSDGVCLHDPTLRHRRPEGRALVDREEPTKGNQLAKEAHALLAAGVGIDFVGNVEGRDLLDGDVDVIVTDASQEMWH